VHASWLNQVEVFFSIVHGTSRKSEPGSTNTTISQPHWQPPDNSRGTSDADH
jgi:hypothetical protein